MGKIDIDKIWKNNTEIVKKFLDRKTDYEQLCIEVAYILRKRVEKANIEFSTISNRAKTLNSFLEKIERKLYQNPFTEITDFAGVRVVYLYQKDLGKIEEVIKKEFEVIERVDKLNEKGTDKFGYGAIHFIIKIGKKTSGARYDDLKDLLCEIQVRTVLQDAWAIIDHHLVYKNESDIPSNLQRKLNSLAGLFETADNQFDSIRDERENYLTKLNESIGTNNFLDNELNLDTFIAYLKWKFPKYSIKYFEDQPMVIFEGISNLKLRSLKELDNIISKYENEIPQIKKDFEDEFRNEFFREHEMPSSLLISTILNIDNEDYFKLDRLPINVADYISKKYHKSK